MGAAEEVAPTMERSWRVSEKLPYACGQRAERRLSDAFTVLYRRQTDAKQQLTPAFALCSPRCQKVALSFLSSRHNSLAIRATKRVLSTGLVPLQCQRHGEGKYHTRNTPI